MSAAYAAYGDFSRSVSKAGDGSFTRLGIVW